MVATSRALAVNTSTSAAPPAMLALAAGGAEPAHLHIDRETRDVVRIMLDLVCDQLSVPQAVVSLGLDRAEGIVITNGGDASEALDPVLARFCLDQGGRLVIDDTRTLDESACPSLSGDALGAYLGLALVDGAGRPLGVLCAVDTAPRRWSKRDIDTLRGLAAVLDTEFRTIGLSARAA